MCAWFRRTVLMLHWIGNIAVANTHAPFCSLQQLLQTQLHSVDLILRAKAIHEIPIENRLIFGHFYGKFTKKWFLESDANFEMISDEIFRRNSTKCHWLRNSKQRSWIVNVRNGFFGYKNMGVSKMDKFRCPVCTSLLQQPANLCHSGYNMNTMLAVHSAHSANTNTAFTHYKYVTSERRTYE